jgi:hypothetical protein
LTQNDTISYSDLFIIHRETIENEPDLLGPPVDTFHTDLNNEETDQEYEGLEDDEYTRPDCMILSEMGPNTTIQICSDFGLREVDRNHDWNTEVR